MLAASAIPVTTGITPTTIAVGILNILVAGMIALLTKSIPQLKKIASDRETGLATVAKDREVISNEREANLLKERAEEMEMMRASIAAMQKRLDAKDAQHDEDRAIHEAERAVDRHRINNLQQCFDAFVMLVKANPDKAAEALIVIEDMRAKQLVAEASEKASIRAAAIEAASKRTKETAA